MADVHAVYADALASLMADALTGLHKVNGAATKKMVENVEAGRARFIIISEVMPTYKVRCVYVAGEESIEVFTVSSGDLH